jgi:hypothetical protein
MVNAFPFLTRKPIWLCALEQDRWFESDFLQQTVHLSREVARRSREPGYSGGSGQCDVTIAFVPTAQWRSIFSRDDLRVESNTVAALRPIAAMVDC